MFYFYLFLSNPNAKQLIWVSEFFFFIENISIVISVNKKIIIILITKLFELKF